MERSQNFLTIKAFAEAAGRSQQTIYKQIGTRLAPYVHEIEGQKYIEHRALKEVFGVDVEQPTQPKEDNPFNPDESTEHPLYAILKEELAAKNRQLEARDKQIEQLQAELADERKHSRELTDRVAVLAEQAQALHAGTIKTQLPPAEEPPIEVADETAAAEPKKRVGFFDWLLGRGV